MAKKPATLREYVRTTFSYLAISEMASDESLRAVREIVTPEQTAEMYDQYQAELWGLAIATAKGHGYLGLWDWLDHAAPGPTEDFHDVRATLVQLALPWLAECLDAEWMDAQGLHTRYREAEEHLEALRRRPPHPRERYLPMDVAGRCRRAGRQLVWCQKALYRWEAPKGGPADLDRARQTVAQAERELVLADELVARLAGKATKAAGAKLKQAPLE